MLEYIKLGLNLYKKKNKEKKNTEKKNNNNSPSTKLLKNQKNRDSMSRGRRESITYV